VFATNAVNNALKDAGGNPAALGLIDGNASQIVNQLIGAAIAWALAAAGTFLILKVCDVVCGVRVDTQEEEQGLDLAMHGEEAYSFDIERA
jgi:Amt family ammonium transporter